MYITKGTLQIRIVFTFAEAKGSVFPPWKRAPFFFNSLFLQWICHLWGNIWDSIWPGPVPDSLGEGSGRRNLSLPFPFFQANLKKGNCQPRWPHGPPGGVFYLVLLLSARAHGPINGDCGFSVRTSNKRKQHPNRAEKWAGLRFLKPMIFAFTLSTSCWDSTLCFLCNVVRLTPRLLLPAKCWGGAGGFGPCWLRPAAAPRCRAAVTDPRPPPAIPASSIPLSSSYGTASPSSSPLS